MTPPPIHESGTTRKTNMVPWILTTLGLGFAALCIVVLTTMLVPEFGKAREARQRSGCISRLHQQATAFDLYCNSYDDEYPPGSVWMDAIATKDSESFRNLLAGRRGPRMLHCPAVGSGYGYAMNLNLSGRKRNSVKDPSHVPLTFDSVQTQKNALTAKPDAPIRGRHGSWNCFLYADLHTHSVRAGQKP